MENVFNAVLHSSFSSMLEFVGCAHHFVFETNQARDAFLRAPSFMMAHSSFVFFWFFNSFQGLLSHFDASMLPSWKVFIVHCQCHICSKEWQQHWCMAIGTCCTWADWHISWWLFMWGSCTQTIWIWSNFIHSLIVIKIWANDWCTFKTICC